MTDEEFHNRIVQLANRSNIKISDRGSAHWDEGGWEAGGYAQDCELWIWSRLVWKARNHNVDTSTFDFTGYLKEICNANI